MSLGQLRWRCRRGMKELDRAFLFVLEEICPQRDERFREDFAALTEVQDPDIMAMLVGRLDAPERFQDIVAIMRDCGAKVANRP